MKQISFIVWNGERFVKSDGVDSLQAEIMVGVESFCIGKYKSIKQKMIDFLKEDKNDME